jgi:hypothetical protein
MTNAHVSANSHEAIPLLLRLDDAFEEALLSGAIKLVRADYLRHDAGDRILRRQELEAVKPKGRRPFLLPKEAVAALRENGRKVGALTYGWTALGQPDASGAYLAAVRRFLCSAAGAHITAVFWECAARDQLPRPAALLVRVPHVHDSSPADGAHLLACVRACVCMHGARVAHHTAALQACRNNLERPQRTSSSKRHST